MTNCILTLCCICRPAKPQQAIRYGEIIVRHDSTDMVLAPDIIITLLKVECAGQVRTMWHFQYTTWPDHGVPETTGPVLKMLRKVREKQPTFDIPVVIHCSAGCGRTGTLAAIDYLWHLMRLGWVRTEFSVFQVIDTLRERRQAMVQTLDQYIFVYRCVLELTKIVIACIRDPNSSCVAEFGPAATAASMQTQGSSEVYGNIGAVYGNINGEEAQIDNEGSDDATAELLSMVIPSLNSYKDEVDHTGVPRDDSEATLPVLRAEEEQPGTSSVPQVIDVRPISTSQKDPVSRSKAVQIKTNSSEVVAESNVADHESISSFGGLDFGVRIPKPRYGARERTSSRSP